MDIVCLFGQHPKYCIVVLLLTLKVFILLWKFFCNHTANVLPWPCHWRVWILLGFSHTPITLPPVFSFSCVILPFLHPKFFLFSFCLPWSAFKTILQPCMCYTPTLVSLSWLLFCILYLWSYCAFIVREIHLLSTQTHTKTPREVISLGLQLSEQQASVGRGIGDSEQPTSYWGVTSVCTLWE